MPGETGADYTCPEANGLFPDEESGCKSYYICNQGKVGSVLSNVSCWRSHRIDIYICPQPFKYTCQPNLLFDASLGACNWHEKVDDFCNVGGGVTRGEVYLHIISTISTTFTIYYLKHLQEPQPSPIVIELPGETGPEYTCPGDGTFPDMESGCEQYYVCNQGKVSHQIFKRTAISNILTLLLLSSRGSTPARPACCSTLWRESATGVSSWTITATLRISWIIPI